MTEPNSPIPKTMSDFSDDDFKETMRSAIRLELILCAVAIPVLWWKLGWGSAALLAVGALISGSGLWEWLRLMSAVMVRMDNGGATRPLAMILVGFFLRLGLAVVVLYVSLKLLNGSVFALAAGLGLGVFMPHNSGNPVDEGMDVIGGFGRTLR